MYLHEEKIEISKKVIKNLLVIKKNNPIITYSTRESL